jgi:hypothetical protein
MNDQSQVLLRAVKGPIIMITVGVLFAADRFTDYHFHETWPVLLIVIGIMQLLVGRGRRRDFYPPPPPPPSSSFSGPPMPSSRPGDPSDPGVPRS